MADYSCRRPWLAAFEEPSGRGTPSIFCDPSRNSAARTSTMSVIGVVIRVKTAMRTSCSTGRDCWTERLCKGAGP